MNINFPKPKPEQENNLNPLKVLESFCEDFNKAYGGHFFGNVITSSNVINENTVVINYSFWIDFSNVKDYSYRFFEAIPESGDGGFPLKINAFNAPVEDFKVASTPKVLLEKIDEIFNSERGRFIILSNY